MEHRYTTVDLNYEKENLFHVRFLSFIQRNKAISLIVIVEAAPCTLVDKYQIKHLVATSLVIWLCPTKTNSDNIFQREDLFLKV